MSDHLSAWLDAAPARPPPLLRPEAVDAASPSSPAAVHSEGSLARGGSEAQRRRGGCPSPGPSHSSSTRLMKVFLIVMTGRTTSMMRDVCVGMGGRIVATGSLVQAVTIDCDIELDA